MSGRVLFDLQVFAEQRHGGVSRYFRELGRALRQRQEWEAVLPPGIHIGSSDLPMAHVGPLLRLPAARRGVRLLRAVNLRAAKLLARRVSNTADVVHPTWYHRPSLELWADKPLVITIHDMIPEAWPSVTTPEQLDDRAWAIREAAQILCVSETTRLDLVHRFPDVEERASVAYPGMTPLPPVDASREGEPRFVYVGKRGAYKDFATCLRALQSFPARLVVVGGGPPSEQLVQMLHDTGTGHLVEFRESPDDFALAELLAGSTALISTSRQEGFGMPPLEALSVGTSIILSDIPVHREVYGEWGTFFEPGEHEGLAEAMRGVAAAPPAVPAREELARRFSWTETARAAEIAYTRAAG